MGYLNYSLFGTSYAVHFAVFFLMQLLGILVFVHLLRELVVPPLPAAGMALLFLFNPAFMNDGLVALSSHFDVLAGVFAMTAFLAAWRERYGVAILLSDAGGFHEGVGLVRAPGGRPLPDDLAQAAEHERAHAAAVAIVGRRAVSRLWRRF